MRLRLPLLVALLLVLVSVAHAVSVVNVISPIPSSTVTASRALNFTFVLDTDQTVCYVEIGLTNNSIQGNHTNATNLASSSDNRRFNYTKTLGIDSAIGQSHNWSVYCGANASTSALINTYSFKLRTVTPTGRSPVNGSTSNNSLIALNATTSVAIAPGQRCWYQLGFTNGTLLGWQLLNFTDSANTTAVNGSVLPMSNSSNAAYHNVTYRCNDTSGNYTSETYSFKIDQLAPALTMNNLTVVAGVASINVSIVDNNTGTCAITLNGTSIACTIVGSGTTSYATGTVTGAEWALDGNVTLSVTATDVAGNLGTAAKTGLIRNTLNAGWNLISSPVATNLSDICSKVSGCTGASWFNNTNKSFVTYSTLAASVNNGYVLNPGDGVLVYVPSTAYLIANDFIPTIGSGDAKENITLTAGWNLMGLTLGNTTPNGTLIQNATNFTFASAQNLTSYVTCSNNSVCSNGDNSHGLAIPKGQAVWVLITGTQVLNRSKVNS